MQITSTELASDHILCWSDVFVTDDKGELMKGVKKVVLTIEAGDVAKLDIETYSADLKTTETSSYCVNDIVMNYPDTKDVRVSIG